MTRRSPDLGPTIEVKLSPHPASPVARATRVSVSASRSAGGRLHLWYRTTGTTALRLSHEGSRPEKSRRNELWKHTCCEAFIRTPGGYYEFNFAPSGDWAAFQFTGYREGMSEPVLIAPGVSAHRHGDGWQLQAFLDLQALPGLTDDAPLCLGLSAVLEMKDGVLSYWALAHQSDKPDFHHPDSFTLTLPPLEPA